MRVGGHEAVVSLPHEAAAIGALARELCALGVDEVLVVDGARATGRLKSPPVRARVIVEPRRGYGRACAVGVLAARGDATVAGRLAGVLMRTRYGVRYTDMVPFRAIRRDRLEALGWIEATYGWNLEMQMRAAASRLRIRVPVRCRRRAGGRSKVSGEWRAIGQIALDLTATFLRIAANVRAPFK